MSHSIIKEFPSEASNPFVIVVNQNGEAMVEHDVLNNLMSMGNADVSIIRVNDENGATVDLTVDTFQPSTVMDSLNVNVEDETLRNYNNFRMDHCYTPLTSPSQGKPLIPPELPESDPELDDLAQTLSILEGSDKPLVIKPPPAGLISQLKSVQNEAENELLNGECITVLQKVGKINLHKVYKGLNRVLPKNHKIYKKAAQPQLESEIEDDDLNDSDFEVNDVSKVRTKRTYKRRSKLGETNHNASNIRHKVVKIRKGVKHIYYKPAAQKSPSPEHKLEIAVPVPTAETNKLSEMKKSTKKEKKISKPVVDGIALFSTPDIIRRVGSGKAGEKTPENIENPKAKIDRVEDRPKIECNKPAIDLKSAKAQRHSLDSKITVPEKIKPARMSLDSKHPDKRINNQSESETTVRQPTNSMNVIQNNDEVFNNVEASLTNIPVDIPAPSVPIIEPIINEDNAKTYPENIEPEPVDQSQLNLESAALDIDQGILGNLSTDELIPEDILYQVAKLVENPDVQNVIDRTLVDGSLNLEPNMSAQISEPPRPITHVQPPTLTTPPITTVPDTNSVNKNTATQKPIQIVRSDGRVVILPPIEKPATRSSKKKQDPGKPMQSSSSMTKILPAQKHAVKIPQEFPHNIEAGPAESDSDESWKSEDDPDRLWCICKQPHNNRFMICCDTCEDWFHGKCVSVTKAMGQLMEQQGKEWLCPNCSKKTNAGLNHVVNPASVLKPPKIQEHVKRTKSVDTIPPCIVCAAPSRPNSVYCSDQCILKHAQGVEKETKQTMKTPPQKIILFERSTGKCLSGPNVPSAANLKQWLKEHPGFEVVRPVNKSVVNSKLQFVKNGPNKDFNRKNIQVPVSTTIIKQQVSPNTIKLIPATKMNVPGIKQQTHKQKVLQMPMKSPPLTTSVQKQVKPVAPVPKLEKPRERKQKLQPQISQESVKQNAQENIRDTVKKTLYEQLMTRLKEVDDIKLTDDEVNKMATDIETQLYKLFGDSGPKYRAKYRSLIFNIKDTKNQTLWRRICEKTIAPPQLVKLSPEEMASQELARWRERENKHQLDMIKKSELEMLSINRTYVLKTHKGEQVMEDRPSVQVDSTEMVAGLGADSTSEQDIANSTPSEKQDQGSDHGSDRKSSKHSRRDKDREKRSSKDRSNSKDRRSKDRSSMKSDRKSKRSRSRERDKDRSSHRSDKKRSRSRDRHHRSHKSSKHSKDRHSTTDHLDKKSREILDNLENSKLVPPPEDRLWKHVAQQDIQVATPETDSDHEPTSTVIIPTPPRSTEQEDAGSNTAKSTETTTGPSRKADHKTDESKASRTDPRLTRMQSTESSKSENSLAPVASPVSGVPVTVQTTPLNDSVATPPQVKYTSESKEAIIWEGNINMVDVAKFFITMHEVSGDCSTLGTDLPSTLEIVGRISHDTVWDYIGKMRRSNSKLISILRLTAANMEEKMPYIALYSYLSSRDRLGVIRSTNSAIKDFYILPLASNEPIPQALLPITGPGFEENRPPLLLGIIVRTKRKRPNAMDIITAPPAVKRGRIDNSPVAVQPTTVQAAPSPVTPAPPIAASTVRSYTPPPTRDPRLRLPVIPATANDEDEPYSPEDSDPEVVMSNTMRKLTAAHASVTVNVAVPTITTSIKSTFLDTPSTSVQPFEPFSSKFDGIPGLDVSNEGVECLQRKMAELDKCIEIQKEEIRNISQDIATSGSVNANLSNISLPSNLQQILDSIKNIPSTIANPQVNVDEYCPTAPGYKTSSAASDELTIPLLLPKINSRTQSTPPKPAHATVQENQPATIPLKLSVMPRESREQVDNSFIPVQTSPNTNITLPNTNVPPPSVVLPNLSVPPPVSLSPTIPLNLPAKTKAKLSSPPPNLNVNPSLSPPGTVPVHIPNENRSEGKATSVLSMLSEEELIRRAAEMLADREDTSPEPDELQRDDTKELKSYPAQTAFKSAPVMYVTPPISVSAPKRTKIDVSQPPVPGLEDEYEQL